MQMHLPGPHFGGSMYPHLAHLLCDVYVSSDSQRERRTSFRNVFLKVYRQSTLG